MFKRPHFQYHIYHKPVTQCFLIPPKYGTQNKNDDFSLKIVYTIHHTGKIVISDKDFQQTFRFLTEILFFSKNFDFAQKCRAFQKFWSKK